MVNNQATSKNLQLVELDHSIGFSGKVNDSVFLHPNSQNYLSIAGCSVVVGDLSDPHSQHFLTAHDDLITCLAVSNNGHLIASGKCPFIFLHFYSL